MDLAPNGVVLKKLDTDSCLARSLSSPSAAGAPFSCARLGSGRFCCSCDVRLLCGDLESGLGVAMLIGGLGMALGVLQKSFNLIECTVGREEDDTQSLSREMRSFQTVLLILG